MAINEPSTTLHERNAHRNGYAMEELIRSEPSLKQHVIEARSGKTSIDFHDSRAIFALNKALLKHHYGIQNWKILKNSLCPVVPGRADYVHYLADFLPDTKTRSILDVGTGSSIIYPLLGATIYDWDFVGTDTHLASLQNAQDILASNPLLQKKIKLRHQVDEQAVLKNCVLPGEYFDAVMCNPPFFKSRQHHWDNVVRKHEKLYQGESLPKQNYGGLANELWREGGEKKFVLTLINESLELRKQLGWVSSLISDKDHLKPLIATLEYNKASRIEIIPMAQGHKKTRILMWQWDSRS